jgi:hypothetical protein
MSEKKPSLFSAVAPPVLAAGAGALAGGIAGGLGARALLQAPGIRARLAKMTPARRKEVARAIELVGAPIIGTAGAVGSMATREYLDAKMQERRKMEAELAARSRGAT